MPALSLLLVALSFVPQDRPVVFERDPRELPRAVEERWVGWSRDAQPPEALREPLIESLRAYRGGHFPRALEATYAVLEEEPEYPPALHQLGVLYFRLRRYGDAAFAFERFLEHAQGEVVMTRALGHAYYSLGRYEEARGHYERILKDAPRMVEARRGYALALMRIGETQQSLEELRKVVELEPEHAEAHTWIAQILFDEERSGEARAAAEVARELAPYEPRSWFLLGRILYDLGEDELAEAAHARYEELQQVAQEALFVEAQLQMHPESAGLWHKLASIRSRARDVPRTRAAISKLILLDTSSVEVRVFAMNLLDSIGDREGADANATGLETNCADRLECWEALKLYYAKTKNRVKQVRAGERYLRLKGDVEGG